MRTIHRLLLRRYGLDPGQVLNDAEPDGSTTAPDAGEMLACLRTLIAGATRPDGQVDYRALHADPAYARYRSESARLRHFDPERLARRAERLAFWINLYNAVVIDAVTRLRIRGSVRDMPGFFWKAAYDIGGLRYSANDIEHGILRANGVYPRIPGRHFGAGDRRRRHAVSPLEPRVHFALVCASRSCPPIRAYSPQGVDDELNLATAAFIGATSRRDDRRRRLHLSRIFLWYADDFGGNFLGLGDRAGLRNGIAHLARPSHPELAEALADRRYRLAFEPYDWSLNGVGAEAASTRIRASNSSRQSPHSDR